MDNKGLIKMLGEILEIKNNKITLLKDKDTQNNILNLYVKITDGSHYFVGEVTGLSKENIYITLHGEIKNNHFVYGINTKPSFDAKCTIMPEDDLKLLFYSSNNTPTGSLYLGKSVTYNNLNIFANINSLFSNHFVILGNTGSGKSCATARILQNLFYKKDANPSKATFFIIDAYGEYEQAFSMIDVVNKDLAYKNYISDPKGQGEFLQIPLWLLTLDDICLLLGVTSKNQIPIIEKALKLLDVFVNNNENSEAYQNSIIARALLDIFINGNSAARIRDQVFSVLSRYHTPTLNLETPIFMPGYTRPLKQCLLIDESGKLKEMQLVTEFLQSFVLPDLDLKMPNGSYKYALKDLLYALDFALIDEGLLNDENIYAKANELRVRLAGLIDGEYNKFFELPKYFTKEAFIHSLTHKGDKKCQVINLNINAVDDRFAKTIAKIYSKMLFDYTKNDIKRASMPMHILLEEAHRYVQNDFDIDILGYNIFERIAKEGRKYGILLGLISQRPSELSQTVLSQCNNFIIFKITHPVDLEYVNSVVPFVDDETIQSIKCLQIGTCLTFGNAFKLPILTHVDLATPTPYSSSADIEKTWF